jgi:hydrogenase expression/formation protein HypE
MIGKVPPEALREFAFARTGARDDAVLQGPAYGEDTAAIDLGDQTLVVNSDPLSLAVERIGTLGVDVACNDVAASGADPRWLSVVVFLPDDDPAVLDEISRQLDEEARRLGVAIVGGHSEYAPTLENPMLSLTCLGLTDDYVATGGAQPGDRLVLTKGAGIEATAILATDFRERLAADVPAATFDRAVRFFDELGVVREAAILREVAHAMHDPTEGGLVAGLVELAVASGVALDVERDAIPVRQETAALTAAAGVDPLRVFGSGALLAAVPADVVDDALDALHAAGITADVIGEVSDADEGVLRLDGEPYRDAVRDDMYALWE